MNTPRPERCIYCDGHGSCDGFMCGFCEDGVPLDTQEDWDNSWGRVLKTMSTPQDPLAREADERPTSD